MLQSIGKSFDPKAEARRFALFVVLGGCAALVNWASRFPLERIVSFSVAVAMAYMIGQQF
jgi:putative flippase GtrA